jgi:hypothetical protein
MGLGSVREGSGAKFLVIAGGFIWDKKADASDPDYNTQDYEKADKSIGTRKGAQYGDLTGSIKMVEFRTHPEYGESVNVTLDSEGERYIISISTNNRYSQDMMKALLKYNMNEEIFIKPYDFVGKDKKRAQGISFRQKGDKIDLKNDEAPFQDAEWFKSQDKKKIKRFFEDLSDWYVAEVEASIIPKFKPLETIEKAAPKAPKVQEAQEEEEEVQDEEEGNSYEESAPKEKPATKEVEKPQGVTPLKMKMKLKAYIIENYEGEVLPALSKEDLEKWYELCLREEELPFEDSIQEPTQETAQKNEVADEDLQAQLDKLAL